MESGEVLWFEHVGEGAQQVLPVAGVFLAEEGGQGFKLVGRGRALGCCQFPRYGVEFKLAPLGDDLVSDSEHFQVRVTFSDEAEQVLVVGRVEAETVPVVEGVREWRECNLEVWAVERPGGAGERHDLHVIGASRRELDFSDGGVRRVESKLGDRHGGFSGRCPAEPSEAELVEAATVALEPQGVETVGLGEGEVDEKVTFHAEVAALSPAGFLEGEEVAAVEQGHAAPLLAWPSLAGSAVGAPDHFGGGGAQRGGERSTRLRILGKGGQVGVGVERGVRGEGRGVVGGGEISSDCVVCHVRCPFRLRSDSSLFLTVV